MYMVTRFSHDISAPPPPPAPLPVPPPRVVFFLHEHIVEEEYGKPERKEPLSGPDGQVRRAFYPGLVLEYDKIENGNTILAAMEVVKMPEGQTPPPPAFP